MDIFKNISKCARWLSVVGVAIISILSIYWVLFVVPVSEAKSKIGKVLFDPTSAQYEYIYAVGLLEKQYAVCGALNAKNRFGGYIGVKRFFLLENGEDPLFEDQESSKTDDLAGRVAFEVIWKVFCKDKYKNFLYIKYLQE